MRTRACGLVALAGAAALGALCMDSFAGRAPGRVAATCEALHSVARKERLSTLLRELAAVRAVRLENWSDEDPIVVFAGGSDVELMKTLSGQVNLIARYVAAKDCPGQWMVETIWVLPGRPGSPTSYSPKSMAATPAPGPALAPSPTEAAEARAATDMYMRAHGSGGKHLSP